MSASIFSNTSPLAYGATAFVAAIIGLSFLRKRKQVEAGPTVSKLFIYPIKSCKGISLDEADIIETGFQYDRAFVLIDEKNQFITQRKSPKMALIDVSISLKQNSLIVTAPGMTEECRIPLDYPESESTIQRIKIWSSDCDTIDAGNHVTNEWFSKYLGIRGVRIMRMHRRFVRKTPVEYAPNGQTAFADGFPFLVMSEASLEEINKTLPSPITIDRFRPNIVIRGCKAFAEDQWTNIRFISKRENSINMKIVKPCSRCTIPNINPSDGVMDKEHTVTKALQTFRTGEKLQFSNPKWRREVFVAQNADHDGRAGGKIALGDRIEATL